MEESDKTEYMSAWRVVEEGLKRCPEHGNYEASLMAHRHPRCQAFWTRCPRCNEEIEKEEKELQARYEACLDRDPGVEGRLNELLLAQAGVPRRYHAATLKEWSEDNTAMEKVGKKLREYCEGFEIALEKGSNMIFIGNPGTGKTFAACAIINHLVLKKDHSASYVTANDFLTRLRNCYGSAAEESDSEVFDDYAAPSLLVVDEIGRHKDSQHAADSLFALLDRRYREVRPTILISNMGKDEFVEFLGDAMISRLRQEGQMLGFYWEDQRK